VGTQVQKTYACFPAIYVGVILVWSLFVFQLSHADIGVVYKEARPMKALAGVETEKVVRAAKAIKKVEKKADSEERLVKVDNGDAQRGKTAENGKVGKEEYAYDPRGKVDPFVPFITTAEKSFSYSGGTSENTAAEMLKKLREAKTELQTIKLSDLTLTAIIKTDDKTWAMVSGPGGRGYILKKGTYVGTEGGVVERVVYENKKTPFGVEAVRKVIVKEPYVDAGGELSYRLVEKEMAFPGNSAAK
jgi:hypothetical protein